MATIRRRGDSWQAQVRRKGRTVSRSFIQKTDAQQWANQAEIEADRRGLSSDRRALSNLKVSDVLERFRDSVIPLRPGRKIETIVIDAFLRNPLAKVTLLHVTPSHFATYRDERLTTVKAATINRQLGLIHHIFEVARTDWGIPIDNPIKGIRKPKADRPRERRLSGDEFERLLEALKQSRNPLLGAVVRFAIATGMRRGELLNARWKDLNWQVETLYIPVTKNGEPRTIPLSFEARRVIVELAIAWAGTERIFPTTAEAVKLAWKRLTKRAKIADLHFHDLRHEAVSQFFERGLSIPEVALISGHKDPRMLFRYTHLKAEDVARKLNSPNGHSP
jgi:integrase